MLIEKEMDSLMDCQRLPFMPDTPDDDLVLLHQYHVSETYPMHSHEFYEIFYVVKGQALHQINGSSQIVTEGSLVFIHPDDVHCYQLLNFSDFEFINVNISLALTAQAFLWMRIPVESATDPALPPSIKLTGPAHLEMRRRFTELSQMPSGPSRRRTFCALLPELLLQLFTRQGLDKAQVVPRWMADVLRQLDQPKNFICGLPALLSMTSYTQEHLTRSFRKYVHLSPTAYINQKRLGYAAELMVNSGATPPQAAQQAGFHNISHFYHLFHQQYSCTPLQFSAQYRDAQRSQSARLFDISHRAARECAQHNAVRVPLEKGLFAYYLDEGLAQIYLSLSHDVTDRDLNEASSCWDPRITPGATLHINGGNQALCDYVQIKFGRAPIWQAREFSLPRDRFVAHCKAALPDGIRLENGTDDSLPLCHEIAKHALPDASLQPLIQCAWGDCTPDQLLLLFYGETPVGFACMIDDSIPLFALLPEYQGRGWGFFLLCAAMERVFITGASQCYVTAAESAAVAQHLLHKLQFDETGHETVFLL